MRHEIQAELQRIKKVSFILRRLCCAVMLSLMVVTPEISRAAQTQQQAKPTGSRPSPEPAVPAILAAFDKYEVVGMPEAHGMKDVDDFILSLVRNPVSALSTRICWRCSAAHLQPGWPHRLFGPRAPHLVAWI